MKIKKGGKTMENEAIIRDKELVFRISLPKLDALEFMAEYAEAFKVKGIMEGGYYFPSARYQTYDNNDWQLKVVIAVREEKKFHSFLEEFCKKRGIPLKDHTKKAY